MKLHANAALSLKQRERMVLRVIEQGWSLAKAAEAAEVSDRTCSKWVARYRQDGSAGLLDRSSAPAVVANRTDEHTVQLLAALRRLRFTAPELADLLELPASTISGILKRIGMGKLGRLGHEPAQRYERARPGELIHIDVKSSGASPATRASGSPAKQDATRAGHEPMPPAFAATPAAGKPSTSPSMTRPAWPTPKSCPTRKPRPRSPSYAARSPSTRATASALSGCSPTTARPTARPSTRSPAARSASATPARAPTGPRPTARPSASSGPCSTAGPTAARSTPQAQNAPPHLTAGSTTTTITADTQPSGDRHPSPA
jgi:transposase